MDLGAYVEGLSFSSLCSPISFLAPFSALPSLLLLPFCLIIWLFDPILSRSLKSGLGVGAD